MDQAHRCGFPVTALHPGTLWGRLGSGGATVNGYSVVCPLARGEELTLPNLGLETVHHVHADDVAQAFEKTLTHWRAALGESFLVSPAALTLRGFAEGMAAGLRPANLRFLPVTERL